jgi:Ca2+-binding RTX toxin-like protein
MGAGENDTLYGEEGNDTLDGGAGNDALSGGAGNDVYVVDSASDTVVEYAGEGTDEVLIYGLASYALGNNVENARVMEAINTTVAGNSLGNAIWGNAGNDTMYGGAGDDNYFVQDAGDVVVESAAAGVDWINLYIDAYTLAANVENVVAMVNRTVKVVGNGLDNTIVANNGDDTLDGGAGNDSLNGGEGNNWLEGGDGNDYIVAGAGNDTLVGGAGNDTLGTGGGEDRMVGGTGDDRYMVNSDGDQVVEESNQGTDRVDVYDIATYTLQVNVENMYVHNDAVDFTAYGNDLGNIIQCGAGADWLYGWAGNDTLYGGGGGDH